LKRIEENQRLIMGALNTGVNDHAERERSSDVGARPSE
jgi:hypothetical protein